MITHEINSEVEITNISGVTNMGMAVNAKSYSLMIDKLYTKKEDAVVRELAANARDAMNDLAMATGEPIKPFTLTLPNTLCHELVVSDNGTGLSVENVHKYLGNLFVSSKESENNSIGSYGLGSKSPFAVTDAYIIESRHNGEIHSFSFFRAKGKIPQLVHIGTQPTDEPNGITFKVPSSTGRYQTYARAAAAQLFFFEPRPIIYGEEEEDLWGSYGKVLMEGEGWKMLNSTGMASYYGLTLANMGGVSYPLDFHRLSEIDMEDEWILKLPGFDAPQVKNRITKAVSFMSKLTGILGQGICFAHFFAIGDLEIPPSREAIEYDAQTCYSILLNLETFIAQFPAKFAEMINAGVNSKGIKTLEDSLKIYWELIDWRVTDNYRNKGHFELHDAISTLNWDMEISSNLPKVTGRDGVVQDGTLAINALQPCNLSSNLHIAFPHSLKTRTLTDKLNYACDDKGVPVNGAGAVQSGIKAKIDGGWTEKDRGIIEVKNWRADVSHQIQINFTKEQEYWEPCIQVSENIVPPNGIVNSRVNGWNEIVRINMNKHQFQRGDGYYGNDAASCYVLVDDLEKDLIKFGTYIIRKLIAESRGETNPDVFMSYSPSDYRSKIKYIKADKLDFSFVEAVIKRETNPIRILKLSELEIPKVTRKVAVNNVSMRGVKEISLHPAQYLGGLHNMYNSNSGQRPTFVSIPLTRKEIKPGFMFFNDGQKESIYLDKELTMEIGVKDAANIVSTLSNYMGIKDAFMYRVTPSNFKNVEKYKEEGFMFLGEEIQKVGLNLVGSHKFKRRYKSFLLAYAYSQTGDLGYTNQSQLKEFNSSNKLEGCRLSHHINRAVDSTGKGSMYDAKHNSDIHAIQCFPIRYKNFYEPLTLTEALRVLIDNAYVGDGAWKVHFEKFLPKGMRNEAEGIIRNAKIQFGKYRTQYVKKHFKSVLFSDSFKRDSIEFNSALKEAERVLALLP